MKWFLAIAGILSCAFLLEDTQAESIVRKSYEQARRILEDGANALGGWERIRGIQNFIIVESGKRHRVDLPNPDPTYDTYGWFETTIVDISTRRLFHEIESWQERTLIDGKKGYQLYLPSRTASSIDPSLENHKDLFQKVPQFLLQDALKQASSLRYLGRANELGRDHEVITFARKDGEQISLYFDTSRKLLTKYEYLYTDSVEGDSVQESLYPEYRLQNGFQVPARLVSRMGGKVVQESAFEKFEMNGQLSDKTFALPEEFRVLQSPYYPDLQLEWKPVFDGIYAIQGVTGGSNVLVADLGDSLLVVESPENRKYSGASEAVIAMIKEKLPGKPIGYHVFTHYHSDHSSGTRAYIAEGATILTTPGNKAFVEKMAAAPYRISPDTLAKNQRSLRLQTIKDKKHVLENGARTVELYDVGPYPHVKEELVVYFPKEKLLFEGDLFTSGFASEIPAAQEGTRLLAKKIQELKLDVQQIIGVHGKLRSIQEFDNSL